MQFHVETPDNETHLLQICTAHSSCLESLYLLSLYDELSAAVDGGAGINDSREPGFLRAAKGKEPKQGSSEPKQG